MRITFIALLIFVAATSHAQQEEYTLFVGEFENQSGIDNQVLNHLTGALAHSFSQSKLASIRPVPPGVRSAYLRAARNAQPGADTVQRSLLAAQYAEANAVLMGSYTKTADQWSMQAEFYVFREGGQARDAIQLAGDDVFSLLDQLSAEVSQRLGAGQYVLLSTRSWQAYEAYRLGHQAFYNYNYWGAIENFINAIELDPFFAVAYAELALSHMRLSEHEQAGTAFAKAIENMEYASHQERLVVMGLHSYFRRYTVFGDRSGGDAPDMRDDMVWVEPWLHWHIAAFGQWDALRDEAYAQWLETAMAYADAEFYGAQDLARIGTYRCRNLFEYGGDSRLLEPSLEFITRAADLTPEDGYDDAWKYLELSQTYRLMGQHAKAAESIVQAADANPDDSRDTSWMHWQLAQHYASIEDEPQTKRHQEEWLRIQKAQAQQGASAGTLRDAARRCLDIQRPHEALTFLEQALSLDDSGDRYLSLFGWAYADTGQYERAFEMRMEQFRELSTEQTGFTRALLYVLVDLTELIEEHGKAIAAEKLAEVEQVNAFLQDMQPSWISMHEASQIIGHAQVVLAFLRITGGSLEPLHRTIEQFITSAEFVFAPIEKIRFIRFIVASSGGLTERSQRLLRSPERLASLSQPGERLHWTARNQASMHTATQLGLAWLYEMTGHPLDAFATYQQALEVASAENQMLVRCALAGLAQHTNADEPSQPYVYLEAEGADSISPYFRIAEAPEALGGGYLWAPDTLDSSHNNQGEATYEFEIVQPGTYLLTGRMLGECSYGKHMRIDIGDQKSQLSLGAESASAWLRADAAYGGHAAWEWLAAEQPFELAAGRHQLMLHNQDDGVKLDCMVLYRE